ncbi:hypothetical protein DV515_00012171 [Chloebia gouldiae]|uniref:Uncharacterized protein n=1 Tax=Chloebia gouldiae TaxID=44316 RepID=A0A3L8S474_CHLGU|nr:hypothetical protein DV515_00012171 [Chloebia gouldiae]
MKEDAGSYQPVSLTSVPGKGMEHFILEATSIHREEKKWTGRQTENWLNSRSQISRSLVVSPKAQYLLLYVALVRHHLELRQLGTFSLKKGRLSEDLINAKRTEPDSAQCKRGPGRRHLPPGPRLCRTALSPLLNIEDGFCWSRRDPASHATASRLNNLKLVRDQPHGQRGAASLTSSAPPGPAGQAQPVCGGCGSAGPSGGGPAPGRGGEAAAGGPGWPAGRAVLPRAAVRCGGAEGSAGRRPAGEQGRSAAVSSAGAAGSGGGGAAPGSGAALSARKVPGKSRQGGSASRLELSADTPAQPRAALDRDPFLWIPGKPRTLRRMVVTCRSWHEWWEDSPAAADLASLG